MSTKKATDDGVVEALHELMHLLRATRHRQAESRGLALAHMEAKVLVFFSRRPGETLSALVAHTGRDKSQLARLVASLRERGLLDATPDLEDKRAVRLTLTDSAQHLVQQWASLHRDLAAQAVAGISDQERALVVGYLQQMKANLSSRRTSR